MCAHVFVRGRKHARSWITLFVSSFVEPCVGHRACARVRVSGRVRLDFLWRDERERCVCVCVSV